MTLAKLDEKPKRNPLRKIVWVTAAFALLVPWIAMQFTSEVNWDLVDFLVFGSMLVLVCGAYELAVRLTGNRRYRLAVGIALFGAFLLTWINLAVGIIGHQENPANLMFFAVPLVGLAGALLVRFKSRGMVRSLVATAIAQALIAVIAALAGWGLILVPTGLFVMLWLTSAYLFSKSEQ